jgi:sensor histidine kinase YesM/ligand-binding sensor domain-containing protein
MTVSSCLFSQEMYFTNISNSLNLPSQECYNVIQDSKGYIWITTENGLIKYSKGNTKLFDKKNGLDENAVYSISEVNSGELQLLTSNNRILNLKNDTIREAQFSEKFRKLVKDNSAMGSFDLAYLITKKNNKDYIINSQQNTYLISSSGSKITNLTRENDYNTDAYIIIDKTDKNSLFIKKNISSVFNLLAHRHIVKINLSDGNNNKDIYVKFIENSRLDWRSRICELNGITYLSLHNNLLCIDEKLNTKIITYPTAITSMYSDSKTGLWIGTSSNGVYHYSDINNMSKFTVGLAGLTVSGILVDNEGGSWCTTTEKGVHYSSNNNIQYFPAIKELNKKTTFLKTIGNTVYFSSEIDKLLKLENDSLESNLLLPTGNSDVTDIINFKQKTYLASKSYVGILNKNNVFESRITSSINLSGNITSYQLDSSLNHLYVLSVGYVFRIKNLKADVVGSPLVSKGRCFKVFSDTIILVGCNDGLYKMNLVKHSLQKITGINTAVSKILQTKDGTIYITTKGQGLFTLHNDVAENIPISSGNAVLNDLIEDKNKVLWVSSNEGLLKIERKENTFVSKLFNSSDGLISNSIGQVTICNDTLYVSSPDGICKFSINTFLINYAAPKLYINQIRVNDSIIKTDIENLELEHFQNSIAITIDQFTFKSGKDECVLYALKGYHNEFKKAHSNTLTFENLPPNKYELIVYSVNNAGIKSTKPLILKYTIKSPFWKTLWFIISLTGLILILSYLFVKNIINNIEKREEEKNRINKLISESQLTALQAQMNPHFIFNAINSIQNYILDKNEKQAYDYLSKFSKLIRKVLVNSKQRRILLSEEIETLSLYIEIESLRFENSFRYEIEIDPEINTDEVYIPGMIIQPYVENAIWHGLMNLKGIRKGELKISINLFDEDTLHVIIEDNGVGRKKAMELKSNDLNGSEGMENTRKRIALVNNENQVAENGVKITDMFAQNGEASGTKIEVFIKIEDLN